MLGSNTLRSTLRHEGYAKLAAEVLRDQDEYVCPIDNLPGAAMSLSVKIATNRANQKIVNDGLESLRYVQEI